jgi:hypothetical protein
MEAVDSLTPEIPPPAVVGISPPIIRENDRFFRKLDWATFGITTLVTLSAYLYTLAPEVTLEMSGTLSTAAMYGGVAHPPGFPVWTIYSWIFTKLLPFSNIAWRVAVSSAVAGALTCGLIALMVSRGGETLLDGMSSFRRLDAQGERWLRLTAAVVAGTAFGFNGTSWGLAVIVDTRALSTCLFTIVLCLLLRWSYSPAQKRWLYASFFSYGMTIGASQTLIPAALGLPFFVMFIEPKLGRDLLFAAAVLAITILIGSRFGYFLQIEDGGGDPILIWAIYFCIAVLTGAACIWQIIKTQGFLTEWRPAMMAGSLCLLSAIIHLSLPIASMTNPPVNWGYPRTVEGFFHVLTRGQFAHLNPTSSIVSLMEQLIGYAETASAKFGLLFMLIAIVPFCFLLKMKVRERGILLGWFGFYLCLSLLVVILLNPPDERQGRELIALFYPPSYLLLSLFTGYGLVLIGTIIARPRMAQAAR